MTTASKTSLTGRPIVFSTVGQPEQQRIELWEDHNAQALIGLRCRTLSHEILEATEVTVQLDDLQLARVRGSSHVVERDAELIRRKPTDSVAMFFSLLGEAFFYHEDAVRTLRPGQMVLCDADRPFLRGFAHGLEELVLTIPRNLYSDVTGRAVPRRPVVVDFADGGNRVAYVLAQRIGATARADRPRPIDARTILELVEALAGGRRQADVAAAHLAAARAYIDRHLFDSGLSASQVARAVGISTRHLSRVFAEDRSSLPKYVLARRLEVAFSLLETPEATSLTIAEVARRCGFSSTAYFSNAFVARFGERATDVRRNAAARRVLLVG